MNTAELMSFYFHIWIGENKCVHNIKIILIKFFQPNANLLNFILLISYIKYQQIKSLCFLEHVFSCNNTRFYSDWENVYSQLLE